jgi:hypothetical protein
MQSARENANSADACTRKGITLRKRVLITMDRMNSSLQPLTSVRFRAGADGMFTRWSCCKRTEKDAPACCIGHHEEDAHTAEVFRRLERMAEETTTTSSTSSTSSSAVYKEGWLTKQGHIVKLWRHRFFKLSGEKLSYYSSSDVSAIQFYLFLIRSSARNHLESLTLLDAKRFWTGTMA